MLHEEECCRYVHITFLDVRNGYETRSVQSPLAL
jgi:hypothetical protein